MLILLLIFGMLLFVKYLILDYFSDYPFGNMFIAVVKVQILEICEHMKRLEWARKPMYTLL